MKLGIQYSCPVKWDQLKTLEDKTRFCDLCFKRIYDFQNASDCEIEEILRGKGSVCAKVPASKLEQPITPFQKVLLALVICFSGTLFKVDFAYGQEVENQVFQKDTISNSWEVRGRVMDEEVLESVIGCHIELEGANIGTISDLDGYFRINIPDTLTKVKLIFSYVMYNNLIIEVEKGEGVVDLGDLFLKSDMEYQMIGIIIDIDPETGLEKNSIEYLFQKEKSLPGF
ncbi:MAG: carboxypeptidase-like regulatory domain-containing protein [Crocinitomicaceae bacterium]